MIQIKLNVFDTWQGEQIREGLPGERGACKLLAVFHRQQKARTAPGR
jgi:hypothetical protein